MRLVSVRVRKFRNILDSEQVEIHPQVTCLVGKNESGKTSFLHALYRLNPARPNVKLSVPEQYPAWLEKKDRLSGMDLDEVQPVEAIFELLPEDSKLVAEKYGKDVFTSSTITLSRAYGGTLFYAISTSESKFVAHLVEQIEWARGTKTQANKLKTVEELVRYASELKASAQAGDGQAETAGAISTALATVLQGKTLSAAIWEVLRHRVPQFLYFSTYSALPYSVPIHHLLKSKATDLNDDELTARSLLRLAAADDDYLQNPDYERRKRELENVANALTDDVLKYWSQNPELRVQPDITQKTVSDTYGSRSVIDELKIRIWDQRHSLSLPFDEHSTGFQWFFSFLAAFSEYEFRGDPLVILLDEPALGLHARAQADFLRFIDERLAPRRQVLYTTHSPFMVQPGRLERVRLVEDCGKQEGAKVTSDVISTDPDTLFPLQGALGYDLVQHLFIAPNNLVVEGTSDFTYLRVISDYFAAQGTRTSLDERWSLVPVGGVDLVPTFVALLGTHLNITVLVDAKKGGHQKLSRLTDQGLLTANRILTIGQVLGRLEADIEDLFDPADYLNIFNQAFGKNVKVSDLSGSDPIVKQLARNLGVDRFDHGRPADLFLRSRDVVLPSLSGATLDRFEALFRAVNATLPK